MQTIICRISAALATSGRGLLLAITLAVAMQSLPASAQTRNPLGEGDAGPSLPQLGTAVAFPNLKFDRPVALAYPDDGANCSSWSSSTRPRSGPSPTEATTRTKKVFLKLPDPINRGNEEGLLGLAFHPKYKENKSFLRLLLGERHGEAAFGRLPVPRVAATTHASPIRQARRGSGSRPRTRSKTTTAARSLSGRTATCTSPWETAAQPTIRHDRAESGRLVRIDPADRRRSPVRRQSPTASRPITPPGERRNSPTGRPRFIASACGTSGNSASIARPATLWAGDVGQNLWEMVHRIENGGNYGWSIKEAFHPFQPQRRQRPDPARENPAADRRVSPHADPRPAGQRLEHHRRLRLPRQKTPALAGVYVYGDFDTGRIWGLRYENGKAVASGELIDMQPQSQAEYRVVRRRRRRRALHRGLRRPDLRAGRAKEHGQAAKSAAKSAKSAAKSAR